MAEAGTCEKGVAQTLERAAGSVRAVVDAQRGRLVWKDCGVVQTVLSGVAKVRGLASVGYQEVVRFESGEYGIAFNIDEHEVGCILLCENTRVRAGMEVSVTGRIIDVPVGRDLLGRVLSPMGLPLDRKGPLRFSHRAPIEDEVPSIMERASVVVPLETGIKVIDALVPIGRGQRELLLGDRKTGKTSIALDTIINQKGKDVICIYCAIGQRSSSVAQVVDILERRGCMSYCVVVVAEGSDPPGLRYIAPYAATAIGEYFMRRGSDVLIVYDDLTNHARTYRELSLLLRRPPGREAFPGDIFFLHSRLLERSTHLSNHLGGGSLTALPVVETQAENISAYIPTNLISITDGQIYLSSADFQRQILPAVDIGRSVSRVGGKAQLPIFRSVAGHLKLAYAQFEELETFSRFGTRIDPKTRKILRHGRRVRWCLAQTRLNPVPAIEQALILLALKEGMLDDFSRATIARAQRVCRKVARALPSEVKDDLLSSTGFDADSLKEARHRLALALTELQRELMQIEEEKRLSRESAGRGEKP